MTIRIGSQIFRGELFHLKRNSVHGWIDFGGDWGVRLEVTGNATGELAGQRVRFQASQPTTAADCTKEDLDALADMQVGVVGEMTLRTAADGTRTLYLEWFSQNGQIIAKLPEPILEFGAPAEEESETADADAEQFAAGDELNDTLDFLNGNSEAPNPDDPYQLFPADLDEQLAQSSGEPTDSAAEEPAETMDDDIPYGDENATRPASQLRSWDEVIPGIDPETKRLYEEWDEVIHGTKDVPFTALFDPPLTLKRPSDITSETEAEEQLRLLLARLALHCVVIHMCEHYTALETYRWLLDDLLPAEGVHPRLGPTGFVRHYDTAEHCETCDAEFEARWNARKQDDE